ncbi:hypothetical protein LPJ73_005136, partial [Coemansia sp. RSA 2703]
MASEAIRQRRNFATPASEGQQPGQTEPPPQQQQPKASGTKRSLTIAIGGVLTLLGVAAYTFMRQPSATPVDVSVPEPTATQLSTALASVATKRDEAKKKLEALPRTERKQAAKQLSVLTDVEVTALLRANERSWEALDGFLHVHSNQVASNDPIEDYLASRELAGGRLMVGVFDGHAGYQCAEQLSQRMGPMVDAA